MGGFVPEIADLPLTLLSLVEHCSLVHVLHSMAQHAVDQSRQLGSHGLDRNGGAQFDPQATELRTQIGVA